MELEAQQKNKQRCFQFIGLNRWPPLRISLDWAQSRSPQKISAVELVKFCHRDCTQKNFDLVSKNLAGIVPKVSAIRIFQMRSKVKKLYEHWEEARAKRDPEVKFQDLMVVDSEGILPKKLLAIF